MSMSNTLPADSPLRTELGLVGRMIARACAMQHDTRDGALCDECTALLAYVEARLAHCPYGAEKPTCRKCPVHCYRPAERGRIKAVMRLAGPALVMRGDVDALKHLVHGLRPTPPRPRRGA